MPDPEYVMGIDFGLKHVGVAIGQTLTCSARGIGTISARQGKPNWRELEMLIAEYKPARVIVGLPLNMDSTQSEMAINATSFANKLANKTGLNVLMHDERLTTREAKAAFQTAKALGHASTDHELAACLILESWFAEHQ